MRSLAQSTSKTWTASSVDPKLLCLRANVTVVRQSFTRERKTYLCLTVVTVSAATLVVMFFAATSRPVHMVAKPGQMYETKNVL